MHGTFWWTHPRAKWLTGSATVYDAAQPHLVLSVRNTSARIARRASGAPAFDDKGVVLGIVSGPAGAAGVRIVCVALALPGWLLQTARGRQGS